ncbi:urea ABC transporter ATP-binding subunit UrtE [Paenibacillus filicis]|uniref:Urea ABC transporter ATP-binding subunit UrtE n=1 Tax=Paenibacillus filicis TaxID=669464 RepID=A0ABU9DNM5_9BACL
MTTNSGTGLWVEALESGYGESMVVRRASLHIPPGQVVCLMGRNGVGKTTLLRTVMGLIKPRSGRILYNGRDLTRSAPAVRAKSGIGYVPQGRDIFPQLTVEANLLLGLEAASPDIRKDGIPASIFEQFPVLRDMLHRKGGELSGGQQQQLAIGRALISRPQLLVLDEPMEGIQPSIVMDIERVIESVKAARTTSVLLVEQSLAFATSIADYFYVLDKGTVVAEGNSGTLNGDMMRKHLAV